MSETKCVQFELEQGGSEASVPSSPRSWKLGKGILCSEPALPRVRALCFVLKELLALTGLPGTGICSALFRAGILPLLTRVQPQTLAPKPDAHSFVPTDNP